MYLTYTRHKVKDYDIWKKAFDENSLKLTQNNITWEIVQINNDSTDVAVLCRCPSKKEWDGFVAAIMTDTENPPEKAQEKGGVIGSPEWWAGEVM